MRHSLRLRSPLTTLALTEAHCTLQEKTMLYKQSVMAKTIGMCTTVRYANACTYLLGICQSLLEVQCTALSFEIY